MAGFDEFTHPPAPESPAALLSELVNNAGTELERKEYALLCGQLDAAQNRKDLRLRKRAVEGLGDLQWRINERQPDFWRNMLQWLGQPGMKYLDTVEARKWLHKGKEASAADDLSAMREASRRLWELRVPDASTLEQDMRSMPGIAAPT